MRFIKIVMGAVALAALAALGAPQVKAQNRAAYNHKVVTNSFVVYNVAGQYGFRYSDPNDNLTFIVNGQNVSYHLNDVREFDFLYNGSSTTNPLDTTPIGNFGTPQVWKSNTNSSGVYGWGNSKNGTLKDGDFVGVKNGSNYSFDTSAVFKTSGSVASGFTAYGFDISVVVAKGQVDPFSDVGAICNTNGGCTSTGRIYEDVPSVPEPAFFQLGALIGLGGIAFAVRKRKVGACA